MDRFQQKRSYGRDKQQHNQSSTKVRNYSDPPANVIYTHRPSSTGNSQIRRHVDALDAVSDTGSCSSGLSEDDSFGFELRHGSTKRSSGARIKKLLAEELTKEMDSRRRSPSVIARLMGLDVPPPEQPTHKQEKKFSESYQRRTASIGFVDKNSSHDARSFRTNIRETQEFKDVYEVFETSQAVKHGNSAGPKETTSSKVSEAKMEYIRQTFMDVKRLSSDEKLQHSKELHDALNVLDSNKDVLLKFLQEPDSLFTRHLYDLQGVPPPPPSGQITVLKSSNAHSHNYEKWKLEREQWRNDTSYCRKSLQDGGISHSPNKHNVRHSSKASKVRPEKNEASLLPTRIVVLKPNVGTLQKPSRLVSFPNSSEDLQSAHGKHRSSENRVVEMKDRRLSSKEIEVLKHKAHGSREIAKEITRQMRNSVRSSSSTKVRSVSGGYCGDNRSRTSSVNDSADDSDVRNWKSKYSPLTSYSTESSVSREAKKRISERLKMTNGSQILRRPSRSNTLGEMLAMPDRETRSANQEDNSDRLAWNDGVAKWGTPLGISSRDGWKDEYARSLPRSRSLPSSSTVLSPRKVIRDGTFGSDRSSFPKEAINRGSNQSRRPEYDHREGFFTKGSTRSGRRSNSFSHAEYIPSLQEAHLKPDDLRNNEKNDLLENTSISLAQSDGDPDVTSPITIEIACDVPDNAEMCCDQERKDAEMCYESLVTPEPTNTNSSLKGGNSVMTDPDAPVHEKFSTKEAPKESLHSTIHPVTESESPRSCKEAEQPSPVSILEPVFVDEASPDSDCFGSVSADLQGLRMQLQLLKLESTEDVYSEDMEMAVSSDDETGEGSICFSNEKGGLIERLSDENSRGFSYLIDVLVDSQFLDADTDMQLQTWYAPDCPLNLSVFENLEKKKYGGDATEWPRSERKLFFDRINSGLIEILQQQEDPHPWIKATRKTGRVLRKEPLEEELWKLLLVSEREEESAENVMVLGKDLWLELGDEIDVVGREIERSLTVDLVAEILLSM
ncbi:hypothetical protein MKW94_028603 [Papaver nudicaule]|uniref:DUF4378 domain-containing protein n=1 Tax=Papaver nudicaule TaxID=74823 RepID=A0AA42B410_PAPNU|nr:hypothetical protein [Papaver nudicaule]